MTSHPSDHDRLLRFLIDAHALFDVFRSGHTPQGHRESTASHSWALCLLVLLVEDELDGIDIAHLLRLCILHDLGEAISGDIPAIHQDPNTSKAAEERADMARLVAHLPDHLRDRFLSLWDEYEAGATPEAQLAKGLDKIETMVAHVAGDQVADFDFLWNLGYGTARTDKTPLLRALRVRVDALTRAASARQGR